MLADNLVGAVSSREIADAIARAVGNGELTVGAALPSVRNLAETVGVSPGTVALAYRALRERGVITTAHGRRSRVAPLPALPTPIRAPLPVGVRDLSVFSPDPRLLPDVASHVTPERYRPDLYDYEPVEPSLGALAGELFGDDGIEGTLTVANGSLDAMERILTTQTKPGDAVLVEDPQWVSSLSLFRILGLHVVPVEVDDEGMLPDRLRAAITSRQCAALVLTPRAQNPYGSALTPDRAAQLRGVLAGAPDLLVIEDDHASLIAGAPAMTVTTGRSRWAVIRSTSKALGPDLRVALMVSDHDTADRVQGRQLLGPGWVSRFAQRIVASVLGDPVARERIAVAERTYAERRHALITALGAHGIPAFGRSGLSVLVPVTEEAAVTAFLMADGWAIRSGEAFRLRTPPFVRITVSTLAGDEASALAASLARILTAGGRYRDG